MIKFTKSDDYLSVFIRGEFYTIPRTHFNWNEILRVIKDPFLFDNEKEDLILNYIDYRQKIQSYGDLEVYNDEIYYKKEKIEGYFVDKILDLIDENLPVKNLLAGLERLQKNPSMRIRENLYKFLENGNIVWQEDGRFLAFKGVRSNFTDCYTGTFNNAPGSYVSVPRQDVDDEPTRTCSKGLHVCSYDYLNFFVAEKYLVCAVDPADVVSIPNDYNFTKMRVCAYEVLEEIKFEKIKDFHDEFYLDNEEEFYFSEELDTLD